MSFKFDFFQVFLFTFCIYLKCVCTMDVSSDHSAGKELVKEVGIKTTVSLDPLETVKINKKSENIIEIPIDKSGKSISQPENQGIALKNETSHLVLEGGGVIDLTSTAKLHEGTKEIVKDDDGTNHSKGSKPRKGVQGSSVVPRKGVDQLQASSGEVTLDSTKESPIATGENKQPLNKTELQKVKPAIQQPDEKPPSKVTHPRKPVVVTDIEDVDDFEKYPIIRTSTTGEDYIIIGIVIVLGIWCSIFGALIFYRRAGEYWDRRHYRRMDFLVEGMYND